jgi:hypothetical protein
MSLPFGVRDGRWRGCFGLWRRFLSVRLVGGMALGGFKFRLVLHDLVIIIIGDRQQWQHSSNNGYMMWDGVEGNDYK